MLRRKTMRGALVAGVSVAVMTGLLTGCFYQGRNFDTFPVRNITSNVTTQNEIFATFGEPVRKGLENGFETWAYSYQYYELGQLRDSKDLYVVFNKDNTVKSYSFTAR